MDFILSIIFALELYFCWRKIWKLEERIQQLEKKDGADNGKVC